MDRQEIIEHIFYVIQNVRLTNEKQGLEVLSPIFEQKINPRFVADIMRLQKMFQNNPVTSLENAEKEFYTLFVSLVDFLLLNEKEARVFEINRALGNVIPQIVIKYDYIFLGVLRFSLKTGITTSYVDVLPNGNILVCQNISQTNVIPSLSVLDPRTGDPLLSYRPGDIPITSFIISNDKVLTLFTSNDIILWNPNTATTIRRFEHSGVVQSILLLSNDRFISLINRRLVIWNLNYEEPIVNIQAPQNIQSLDKISDGLIIITKTNGYNNIWNPDTQELVQQDIKYSSFDKLINFSNLKLNTRVIESLLSIQLEIGKIYAVSEDLLAITFTFIRGFIQLIDRKTGFHKDSIHSSHGFISDILPFADYILLASTQNMKEVHNIKTKEVIVLNDTSYNYSIKLKRLTDGGIITVNENGLVKVWD